MFLKSVSFTLSEHNGYDCLYWFIGPPGCVDKVKNLVFKVVVKTLSLHSCTLPFKGLGSLRNVLIFERIAQFFSMKIT